MAQTGPQSMSGAWSVQLLGLFLVSHAGSVVPDSAWRCQNAGAIVAYLALQGPTHREKLMDLFWPECAYAHARANLGSIVRYARTALLGAAPNAEHPILYQRGIYALGDDGPWVTDVQRFHERLKSAREASSPPDRIPRYQQALDLYSGELLPGYYHDWAVKLREGERQAFLEAGEEMAYTCWQTGHNPEAIAAGRRVIQEEPTSETAYRVLMRSYAALDRVDQVALHYRKLCQTLRSQLDVGPSDESQRLYHELTSHHTPTG
ncbi:MAG: hypothetical protein FJ315_05215 [SAR202 cluster bacterium]|nr:hypothetical protein [SAR202 cluster bacterium]